MLKWLTIGGLGMLAILVVVLLFVPQKKNSSQNPSPSNSYHGIQVPVLADAAPIQETPEGYEAGFTNNEDELVLLYGRAQIMSSEMAVDKFNETARNSITKDAADKLGTVISVPENCKKGFTITSQKQFENDTSFGVDLVYSCEENMQGAPFVEQHRFMYVGDGYLYQITLTSSLDTWLEKSEGLVKLLSESRKK